MALRPRRKELNYLDGPVLGIETSCDETSVAVVKGKTLLSNIVSSQIAIHKSWGGIIPELAAREHAENVSVVLQESLRTAGLQIADIKGIGVTNRPGLVGALSVGLSFAKALAYANRIPYIGIHHLEAHLLSPAINSDMTFPHVCLLISGGHTDLVQIHAPGEYTKLGGTIDDAAGEAFDKVARALGLGYPGGPPIELAAKTGNENAFQLPRGLKDPNFNFSFAGLKTAVKQLIEAEGPSLVVADAAASFQFTVSSVLSDRLVSAAREIGAKQISLVGGVAANKTIRNMVAKKAEAKGLQLIVPPIDICTDNAAMVAHVASWRLANGETSEWSLDALANSPIGVGESK